MANEAQVYKNGSPIGTLRTLTDTQTTYEEDFTGFQSGDLIQIYARCDGGLRTAEVRNMRLYYEPGNVEVPISMTNQDP